MILGEFKVCDPSSSFSSAKLDSFGRAGFPSFFFASFFWGYGDSCIELLPPSLSAAQLEFRGGIPIGISSLRLLACFGSLVILDFLVRTNWIFLF